MGNESPEQVNEAFERWFMDADSREEKDSALNSIWEEMSLAQAPASENPYELIKEADNIEAAKSLKSLRRREKWLGFATLMAACMTVFAVIGWMSTESETCLASSDSSKAEFTLPDGTVVWLNRGSRLYYTDNMDGRSRKVRLEGEGYFDVTKDNDHPFIVSAGDVSVKVLGTEFTVSAYDHSHVGVFLESGSVQASVSGHEPVMLNPDQAFEYDASAAICRIYDEEASDHTAWINRRLEFVNKPLTDIIDCLEHWYGINIECNDSEMASKVRLSMLIRNESVKEIFEAIGTISDITYFIDTNGDIKLSFIK